MENSIIKKLQSLPEEIKDTDKWKLAFAIAIDKGSAYYDDMHEAVDCYLHLGFTPEEICEQINFGSLNEKDLDIERNKTNKEYKNQLCCYNGEVLTLTSLYMRFRRARMPNPDIEAKKYLIGGNNEKDKRGL